ncbi:hypothetical protein COCC4DRAFT_76841 [Bipolaris maydis ATCC 48331]|uniref:Homing endonuclease LAGLIDADG domain-containing protein n=1 Tax=Cochliobolus heterostrophus (strain C4 / ATCC 48331 / race T) TaxID=665024 RepID=N4WXG0_COCH4|nr:uncharacterized protein COCC4DRAFT_76841 [Bipolaris maydis ATCC 48331]ENH99035.1 hypothetical protein COCC4DRAFT_76841 [Bipolaris maydis ATCC 48331]
MRENLPKILYYSCFIILINTYVKMYNSRRQHAWVRLSYKLVQSRYNLRLLYYVKKELGVGSVTKDNNKGQFFIRDRKHIENIILPIFDKYPLLTSKYFDYLRFKKALCILNNDNMSKEQKEKELFILKNSKKEDDYLSPRIVHGFGLTQKLDRIVLESIRLILHIPSPVKYKEMYNHYILDTTNSRSIENIIDYFQNTMKGVKSLEYRI